MADHMPMAIPDEVLLWGGALRYWLGRKTKARQACAVTHVERMLAELGRVLPMLKAGVA